MAQDQEDIRVYINPGHGSWTGNDRPCQVIGKPEYSSTNTDTTGFFESNTDLIKGLGMLEKLIDMGVPFDRTRNQEGKRWEIGAAKDLEQQIVMSRVKNGPFEATNTTSSAGWRAGRGGIPRWGSRRGQSGRSPAPPGSSRTPSASAHPGRPAFPRCGWRR